jgi:hypothetical protein
VSARLQNRIEPGVALPTKSVHQVIASNRA